MAEIPEPIPQRSDLTKAKRNVFHRHLAHEGIMLERMQRQLASSERMQRFAATGNTNDLIATAEEQEDMAVSIGNEIHYHITRNGEAQTPVLPTPPTPSVPVAVELPTHEPIEPPLSGDRMSETPGMSWWKKAAIAAALGTGALGSGFGIGYLLNQPGPPAVIDTDTDSITEIDFKDGPAVMSLEN